MSKQWGNGFHKGHQEGTERGFETGHDVGLMHSGEHAWHSVNAAIKSLEQENYLEGLMLLRTLKVYLGQVTGRNI